MKSQNLILKTLVLSILLAGVWWVFQGRPSGIAEGLTAPDFTLKDKDGNSIQLSQFKGKVVVLNFWATTCPPCVSEMASLEKLSKSFPVDQFEVLGVSMDEDGWPAIEQFRKSHPVTFKIILDQDFKVADLYGTYRIPETYIIDKQGVIEEKVLGAIDWAEASMLEKIKKMISRP